MSQTITPIHLDGTTLEGGGQLLRLALSFSSLTQIPIHVTNIRGNRASRGQSGGMKSSHLAAAEWLAKATGAETDGMNLKSKELLFRPGRATSSPSIWKEVRENGHLVRLDTEITLSTPGSVFLILQALLPYLLLSVPVLPTPRQTALSSPSSSSSRPPSLRLTLTGGTNVSSSPSHEYTTQILLPTLSRFLRIPPIHTCLHRRSWSSGKPELGRITIDITPLPPSSHLPAFNLHNADRGTIAELRASILAPSSAAISSLQNILTTTLLASPFFKETPLTFPILEPSGHPKRLYLLLAAESSNGHLLGRDCLFDSKAKSYTTDAVLQQVAQRVVKELEGELRRGGCVDEYMSDQLVVFQALAKGRSRADTSAGERKATLHAQTAIWVAEKVLGLPFDKHGGCDGVVLRVGERFCDRPAGGMDGKEGRDAEEEEGQERREREKATANGELLARGMKKLDV